MHDFRVPSQVALAAVFGSVLVSGCKIENSIGLQRGNDTFYQEEVDEVDILFVVDNSASMTEEQAALAAGFSAFVAELELANSNFHIGVISTSQDTVDTERGKLVGDTPYLTIADDYVAEFQSRITLGINGSDKEKGLEAAAYALSAEQLIINNIGFLRPNANLLVIIVSDEDDCSDSGFLDGYDAGSCYELSDLLTPVRYYVDKIFDSKLNGEYVQIGAIIGPYDGSCENAYSGRRYAEAALQTGGILGKICDADWSNMLYNLGLNAVGILDSFKLSNAADATSIEVKVDGTVMAADPTNGWTYVPNYWVLQFHGDAIPLRGSTIEVTYDIAPFSGEPEGVP